MTMKTKKIGFLNNENTESKINKFRELFSINSNVENTAISEVTNSNDDHKLVLFNQTMDNSIVELVKLSEVSTKKTLKSAIILSPLIFCSSLLAMSPFTLLVNLPAYIFVTVMCLGIAISVFVLNKDSYTTYYNKIIKKYNYLNNRDFKIQVTNNDLISPSINNFFFIAIEAKKNKKECALFYKGEFKIFDAENFISADVKNGVLHIDLIDDEIIIENAKIFDTIKNTTEY